MNLLTGVVEDLDDPLKIGRVKVRIHVLHSDLKNPNNQSGTGVSKDHLPWCQLIQSVTSSAKSGIGTSPTGLEIGSWVVLVPITNNKDIYFILGTFAGVGDLHESVLGLSNKILDEKNKTYKNQPKSSTKSVYPHNKTIHTKSGHLIELDDTPNHERISIYHTSGSFLELHTNGDIVNKSIKDNYSITLNNNNVYAKGNINIIAEGDVNIESENSNVNIKSSNEINLNAKTINATASDVIVNSSSKVTINGSDINVSSSGNCKVSASSLNMSSSGSLTIAAGGGINVLAGTKIRLSGRKVVNI